MACNVCINNYGKNLSGGRGQNTFISGCSNLKVLAVSDHERSQMHLVDEGVDDDIEIDILNEICNDKDDIEIDILNEICNDKDDIEIDILNEIYNDKDDYCDDYIAEEAN
jgi:hypothetical protein